MNTYKGLTIPIPFYGVDTVYQYCFKGQYMCFKEHIKCDDCLFGSWTIELFNEWIKIQKNIPKWKPIQGERVWSFNNINHVFSFEYLDVYNIDKPFIYRTRKLARIAYKQYKAYMKEHQLKLKELLEHTHKG